MKMTKLLGAVALVALGLAACSPQEVAMQQAAANAANRSAYIAKNSLDFNNYDRRQRLSDNPSTIVWCTAVFSQPGAPMITVPIVGKLTSGGKRPFAASDGTAGPDGMYGPSGDYRYGFTPGGNMVEFTGIATFCTTEPTVWQKEKTTLVIETDQTLKAAADQASEHLSRATAAGRANADKALSAAVGVPQ